MARSQLRTRLLQALEMADLGFFLMRANLRRQYPTADEATISAKFAEWLTTRPPLGGRDLKVLTGSAAERRFQRAGSRTRKPRTKRGT